MRTAAAVAVLSLVSFGLSACSGSDAGPPLGPRPSLPTTPTQALWNPCTALDLTRVEKLLASSLSQTSGTPEAPACRFTPTTDGGPVVDVNYQLFDGTIEQLFDSFGVVTAAPGTDDKTDVEDVDVPHSDGARVVYLVQDGTLAITGFVKNGDLVQLVNVVQPEPYDRAVLGAGVTSMLGDLASRADESGLDDS